jgi:hypothetical protein
MAEIPPIESGEFIAELAQLRKVPTLQFGENSASSVSRRTIS